MFFHLLYLLETNAIQSNILLANFFFSVQIQTRMYLTHGRKPRLKLKMKQKNDQKFFEMNWDVLMMLSLPYQNKFAYWNRNYKPICARETPFVSMQERVVHICTLMDISPYSLRIASQRKWQSNLMRNHKMNRIIHANHSTFPFSSVSFDYFRSSACIDDDDDIQSPKWRLRIHNNAHFSSQCIACYGIWVMAITKWIV